MTAQQEEKAIKASLLPCDHMKDYVINSGSYYGWIQGYGPRRDSSNPFVFPARGEKSAAREIRSIERKAPSAFQEFSLSWEFDAESKTVSAYWYEVR